MFLACLALKDFLLLREASDSPFLCGDPETPCWPNRTNLILSPTLAKTACDVRLFLGVRLGLLYPENFSPL